ncbi:MAG: hypothetical protein ACRDBX_07185 [Erysipelotrichaceae bacterium]
MEGEQMKKVVKITLDDNQGSVEYSQSQMNGLDLISFGALLIKDVAQHIHISEDEIVKVMLQLIKNNEKNQEEPQNKASSFN